MNKATHPYRTLEIRVRMLATCFLSCLHVVYGCLMFVYILSGALDQKNLHHDTHVIFGGRVMSHDRELCVGP